MFPDVNEELTVTPNPSSLFPFLVVITITPLDPREPYNAVAAAPLRTLTVSISSGLMSIAPLPKSYPPLPPPLELEISLLTGVPSTINNAWLLP